jgi:serine protease
VHVRNRGGADAAGVNATVYQALVATLITPDMLAPIGSVSIPLVPSGNVPTVSDAIVWRNHYCRLPVNRALFA